MGSSYVEDVGGNGEAMQTYVVVAVNSVKFVL